MCLSAVADVEVGSRQSTQDVAWGPLVFEARRFVELRKKSLWQQFLSSESFGMGLFYTLNVGYQPMRCVMTGMDLVANYTISNGIYRHVCDLVGV